MMHKAILMMAMMVGVAIAAPADLYSAPSQQPSYQENDIPYTFQYGIQDEYAGADFGHNEESDGKTVRGSYTVQLPDSRKQTVTYVVDGYGGYQAEVQYYGEAQYPKEYGPPVTFKPQYQDTYQPQPSYQ
ncbi:cuticle protein 19-like [Panulirus ornatus]|uniref:cuticle protein 19-like n=1 Tax=Panulirus ornatus TaxID=150431 RepID=UPI003A89312C